MASANFINECKNYANCNRYGKLILGEPTTAEIGSSVSITNAQASRLLEDKMSKLSTQETTTGKNLLNKLDIVSTNTSSWEVTQTKNGVIINHKTAWESGIPTLTISLKANTTYTYSQTRESGTGSVGVKSDADNSYTYVANGSHQTTTGSEGTITLRFSSSNETTTEFSFMQLEESTPATSYEPYTYGASPNPNYPQEVNTVKGYRNLFDGQWELGIYNGNTGVKVSNSNTMRCVNYIPVEPSTNYVFSCENTSITTFLVYEYKSDYTYNLRVNKGANVGQTYTTESGTKYITFRPYQNATDLTIKAQIVEGTSVYPYVPYGTNWVYEKITGKNLAYTGWENEFISRVNNSSYAKTITEDNRNCLYYKNAIGNTVVFNQDWKENTQYTFSFYIKTNYSPNLAIEYVDGTITQIARTLITVDTWSKVVITSTSNKTIKYLRGVNEGGYDYIDLDTFQIEEGTQPTTYEPYQENIIKIPLNNNEIAGIGNYKDELIVDKNGHCWLNKKTGKKNLSTLTWNVYKTNGYQANAITDILTPATQTTVPLLIAEKYIARQQSGSMPVGYIALTSAKALLCVDDTGTPSGNVYYVLATPRLIDLNYDVNLSLYEGTNNISNSEDMDMEITYKGTLELNQSNKIQEFTIDSGCYDNGNIVGSVYVAKLNAQLIDALDNTLENVDCDASVGVKYDNDTTEYVKLGSYVVEKPKDEQTTNFSSFVAYDLLMQHLEDKYVSNLDYENDTITIADVYDELCTTLGLTPVTTTFTNSTITVENNPFTNGETNRTVLQSIAKVACAFVDIDDETNEIDLKWLSDSLDYTFQKSDYSTVEGGKTVYGPVNSLIIKNSVIDDENISYSDETSILENGEHQLVINEDYFLYNQEKREEALMPIWNKVNGLTYTECTLNTLTGKPFLKKGAKIRIYLDEENYIDSYVLQNEFKYNGAFANTIKCPVLTEQEVKTKQNASLNEKLKKTEVIINKQNNTITEIVGQINETNEVLNGVIVTTTESERKIEVISTNIDENGEVTSVRTTDGFTFNNEGMNITKSGEAYNTQHTYRGSYFKDGNTIVGQVDVNGGKFKDVDLYGVYRYGKNSIDDEPMFIAQLYTDSNNEECFGHFWNGG